jgi:hypothetical protein
VCGPLSGSFVLCLAAAARTLNQPAAKPWMDAW